MSTSFSLKDFLFSLSLSVVISFFAITNQSLWIDEGVTAWISTHPTFKELIKTQANFPESESLMPFYVWYIWGWVKAFGVSELSLRISNFPLILLFLSTIQWGSKILFGTGYIWIIAAINPFVCFYMNEARSYIGAVAFSSLATVSFLIYLVKPNYHKKVLPWICLLGIFFASGTSMLSVFLIPMLFIALVMTYKTDREMWKIFLKDWLWPILALSPFLLILGGWFVLSLFQGHGGMRGSPNLLNLAFAIYEFFGFLGLGPPRNLIRSAPHLSTFLQSPYVLPLAIGIIGWFIIFISTTINMLQKGMPKLITLLMSMLISGIVLFFIAAFLFHFQFWGRHLIQFFPIFILIIIGLVGTSSNSFLNRTALFTILIIWTFSSIRLVSLNEYKKDDYRGAVSCAVAKSDSKGTILWAANPLTGSYYGLKFPETTMPKLYWPTDIPAIFVGNWSAQQIEHAFKSNPHPIVIALSKPDLFDKTNAIEDAIKNYHGQLIATPNTFKIYAIP